MKEIIGYLIVLIGFLLVTFFGLGPVMFADGDMMERMITLAIVIVLYILLIILFRYIKKTR